MLAQRENITEYIPQRDPIIMLDELWEASDHHATSKFNICKENFFVEDGLLREPGLVENIAQTAAAQVGYQCSVRKVAVPIGYIAAVKNLVIAKLPAVGSRITTSIRIVNQVLDVTIVEGTVSGEDGVVCCTCEMRIFVKAN